MFDDIEKQRLMRRLENIDASLRLLALLKCLDHANTISPKTNPNDSQEAVSVLFKQGLTPKIQDLISKIKVRGSF